MKDCMLDLETLGTRAGCPILSIGACFFKRQGGRLGPTFHAIASTYSQEKLGLKADPATVAWWQSQPAVAKALLARCEEPGALPLGQALIDFSLWFKQHEKDGVLVWSRGADFDLPILAHAYAACGLPQPWAPFHGRCFRTLTEENPDVPKPKRRGVKHNALDDAKHQARWAVAIFQHQAERKGAARRGV